jgi:RNA-directed DNA polymerase
VAEAVEGRRPAKGNTDSSTRPGHGAGPGVPSGLNRVREVARRDKEARFTALLHHVTPARLHEAYLAIRPQAAAGTDGVTWASYGQDLEVNLSDLHARVHGGAYRVRPSRRVYIPKADGRPRPLGIASLEDKIVQRAVVEVLNAVYEADFLGFSYGFRPGRSPHDALDALAVGIYKKKVNWILDADIRDFFPKLDQAWLMKFLEHRIADRRVLRLIRKWLSAGVIEDGNWSETPEGTPQGGSASPLLANVYLHYVLDRWARQWRKRHARGDMIIVRFADDFVVGFQHQGDAKQFLADLRGGSRSSAWSCIPTRRASSSSGGSPPGTGRSAGSGSRRRSISWASRTSAGRAGADSSGSSASRSQNGCEPSSSRSTTSSSAAGIYPSPSRADGWPA